MLLPVVSLMVTGVYRRKLLPPCVAMDLPLKFVSYCELTVTSLLALVL